LKLLHCIASGRIWFVVVLHLAAPRVWSQDLNKGFFAIEHDELAGKSVSSVIKESRGFMWFGTSEGLCRFDGTSVKVYKHDPRDSTSLCHNEVNAMLEDDRHNLWIGTANGLNLYDREKDNFINVGLRGQNGTLLSNHFITSLAFDDEGQIWIGTVGGGVNIFNTRTFHFTHRFSNNTKDSYAASAFINSIVIHHDRAWIGTRAGLRILNIRTLLPESNSYIDRNLFNKELSCAIKGENGNLLFGFSDGEIYELAFGKNDVDAKRYAHLEKITGPASYIHKLSKDRVGNLWVVTEKSGLVRINAATKEITQFVPQEGNPHSAPARSLRTVYCDDQQRIWVGTYNTGVYFIDQQMKKFELYQRNPLSKQSLQDNHVRAFAEDHEGNIWIAGNAGINKLTMRTRELSSPHRINERLGRKVMKDVMIDSQGDLWVGTRDEGVVCINLRTFKMREFDVTSTGMGNNKVVCLYEDKKKTIWAGTLGSGLFYFDKHAHKFISLCDKSKADYVPDRSFVTSIIEDSDSTLWVGTLDGLFTLQRQPDERYSYKAYYQYNQAGNLSSSRIMVVYEDPFKRIWVGTFDNGLNKFIKEKGIFEHYSESTGLTNNSIKGIITDPKGDLWISSTAGISKFSPVTGESKHYSKEDGLNSNTFNPNSCLKSTSGHFIFGGDNGFNIFHPDSIRDQLVPPVVYLTAFKINNKPAPIGQPGSPLKKHIGVTKNLDLSYAQRSFAIDFVALSYGPSFKNQYCYKLEGFEEHWNCTGADHAATYTNIDPGHYTFLVKGSNSDGIWSENPATLEITIHPPLWGTWWAKLLYFTAFAGLMYLFLRIRTERIRIKNQLKVEKIAREKEHELTLSKMNFFTNISHELRTPLSLILMPLEKVVSSSEIPAGIKKSLSVAYKHAANMTKLVNELMDFSKFDEVKPSLTVQPGEVVRFVTEIASTFNEVSERKNIRLILQSSPSEIYGWFDFDKLEKIIRNLLSNAFKFTHDQGEISILVNAKDAEQNLTLPSSYLEITVIDNGIGIAPEEVPLIFNKFYQAKSTSSISHSGTGIGLSLTQTLLEVYRGSIVVESTPDQGTTFIIRLPIDKTSFHENEILEAPIDVISTDGAGQALNYDAIVIDQNLGKPELLIVEDNNELRAYLAAEFVLEFSVKEADNGNDGFRMACEKIPDMVISDIVLPGKTGLCLCKEIKADIRTSHIPVLLLTAKASTEDHVAGLESGADIYMPKPFSIRVLKTHVKQVIAARKKLYARYSQDVYLLPEALADNSIDKEFLQKAVDYIDHNLLNAQLSVESIAELFNISRSQVYRKIKALTGQTVVEFIRTVRLKHALKLMEEKKYNLSEVADRTGFNSLSYFTRSFKDQYGKAPSEYINHHHCPGEID
jgi:signal transduction histidine kinase/ligand-binding sensor domain-containing protein/DNA-binding response OmpR family regulator